MAKARTREEVDAMVASGYWMSVLFPIGGVVAALRLAPYRERQAYIIATIAVPMMYAYGIAVWLLASAL